MNKKIPLWFVLLILWFGVVITILFGWAVWRIDNTRYIVASRFERLIIRVASFPSLVKESIREARSHSRLIRMDVYPKVTGLKVENKYIDSNYILVATYDRKLDQSVAKLIRLSDQKVVHRWIPDYSQIIKLLGKGSFSWTSREIHNLLLYHPLLLPDGSLIFNDAFSPLVKINKDSKLIWAAKGIFHHSVEKDAEGNIWAPSVITPSEFLPNVLVGLQDDAITEVSPEGKIIFRKSVAKILTENGYRVLLFGFGNYEKNLVHLNCIQPALTSGKYWLKGDLLISLRNKSTVFLYRPSTDKILWLKTGPWINQHDAGFIDSSRIRVFGNNMTRIFGRERLVDGYNEEYVYNFKNNKTETPYTEFLKNAKISTLSEGRGNILPNGDLFVEETNNNRLLLGSKKNIIWQYVERIDKNSVATLSWCTFITKQQFNKFTFLKNN